MPNATVTVGAKNAHHAFDPTAAPVPSRLTAVGAVLGLVLAGVVASATGREWTTLVAAASLVPVSVAATHDAATHRLPTRWLAGTATLAVLGGLAAGGPPRLATAVVAAVIAATPLLVVHLVAPSSLGFGDVRCALAVGLLVGVAAIDPPAAALSALVTVAAASGAAIVAAAALRRRRIAFGPCLVLGAATALWWAASFGGTAPS